MIYVPVMVQESGNLQLILEHACFEEPCVMITPMTTVWVPSFWNKLRPRSVLRKYKEEPAKYAKTLGYFARRLQVMSMPPLTSRVWPVM